MGKIKTIVIFAAGYVVGARAGHKRYEQIKNWVQETWGHPAVQEQVDKAGEQAGKLAREVKEHLPGFGNDEESQEENQTNQDSDAQGTASGNNESGHLTDSSSKSKHATGTEPKTTPDSATGQSHG